MVIRLDIESFDDTFMRPLSRELNCAIVEFVKKFKGVNYAKARVIRETGDKSRLIAFEQGKEQQTG